MISTLLSVKPGWIPGGVNHLLHWCNINSEMNCWIWLSDFLSSGFISCKMWNGPNVVPPGVWGVWFSSCFLPIVRECAAEELPFADSSVDLVTVMTAFHWFDRSRFLLEAHRVLKPRGCLALLSYTLDMELSSEGCCSQTLNQVCTEVHTEGGRTLWMCTWIQPSIVFPVIDRLGIPPINNYKSFAINCSYIYILKDQSHITSKRVHLPWGG